MERQIAKTDVENSQGKWKVSTIRTDAGGADTYKSLGAPFSSADYTEETPWPFETMVFKDTGVSGYYHEPYATLGEAEQGHQRIVEALRNNTLEIGKGVRDPFGVPSLTADEWRKMQAV
jgi:hypothetical protein